MLHFIHRFLLARGLGLSPSGFGLPDATASRVDAMVDCGITWRVMGRALSRAHKLATKTPSAKHVHAFETLAWIARRLLGHQLHHDVRNELDLVLYIQELKALDSSRMDFPHEVVLLLVGAMERLAPSLSILWRDETVAEIARKDIIVQAGMVYTRHEYPDYTGVDELFYDGPWPQADAMLSEAKKRLHLV